MSEAPDTRLQHRLELATSADLAADALPDVQTDALREGWLALGQLLEEAQPASHGPLHLRSAPWEKTTRRRQLAVVVGVAAVMMACMTAGWSFWWMNRPDQMAAPDLVPESTPPSLPADRSQQTAVSDGPDELAWDDTLDQRLASAGQEVVRIQQSWDGLDDAFDAVYRGIELVEEDIEGNTL